jgi:hypothetical protein
MRTDRRQFRIGRRFKTWMSLAKAIANHEWVMYGSPGKCRPMHWAWIHNMQFGAVVQMVKWSRIYRAIPTKHRKPPTAQ